MEGPLHRRGSVQLGSRKINARKLANFLLSIPCWNPNTGYVLSDPSRLEEHMQHFGTTDTLMASKRSKSGKVDSSNFMI